MRSLDIFHTDRLIAERLRSEHFDELCRIHQDPKVMEKLAGVRSHDWTRQYIQDNIEHWQRYGYGLWVFRDKADEQFAGRGGLRNTHVGGNDEVELFYSFMPEFWGKGLATEMAKAILNIGFEQLNLMDVVCFTWPTNRASQRVMEKVGFKYDRDITYCELPHLFYRITASEFRQAQRF